MKVYKVNKIKTAFRNVVATTLWNGTYSIFLYKWYSFLVAKKKWEKLFFSAIEKEFFCKIYILIILFLILLLFYSTKKNVKKLFVLNC